MKVEKLFVRMVDATDMFGPSRATFYRAVKLGKLELHTSSGCSLLEISEVISWIKGRNVPAPAPEALGG